MSKLKNLMRAARESIESGEDYVNDMSVDENQAALDDTGLTGEINEEVVSEVDSLGTEMDDVGSALAESDALGVTADRLEASLDDDGAGADPLAAELVQDQLEAAVERHGLTVRPLPARESFGTSKGRRDSTRAFIAAAREADASIKERVVKAFREALEWIKGIIASMLDKAVRVEKRAAAMVQAAASGKAVGGQDSGIKAASLGSPDKAKALEAVKEMLKSSVELAPIARGTASAPVALNPMHAGGVMIHVGVDNGKFSLVRESADLELPGDLKTLDSAGVKSTAQEVLTLTKDTRKYRDMLEGFVKDAGGKMSKFTAIKEGEDMKERWNELSRMNTVNRGAAAVISTSLNVLGKVLDLCDKSLKAGAKDAKVRAPADKAATAATAAAAKA